MIGTIIFFVVLGIIASIIIQVAFGTYIGFIIVGGFVALLILYTIIDNIKNFHPIIWAILCAFVSLVCSIIAVSNNFPMLVLICSAAIGFASGYTMIGDADDKDTEWYDTYWFEIDEKIYKWTDEDRATALLFVGLGLITLIHILFAIPYAASGMKGLAFIPFVFYVFKIIISIIHSKKDYF